jgi:UDP-N-acetylmuramate--alanine ligase
MLQIKYAYFLGIGGIGMSAIARYFNATGITVCGYDKTPSDLTDELTAEGIDITFTDSEGTLPEFIFNHKNETLIVYTPAIPANHVQFNFLKNNEYQLHKRSEVLGIISNDAYCIAVAGTHGKTTTSTLIAHILHECNINFTAFLGGISANYNTNYLHKTDGRNLFPDKNIVVLEADEFDRSFHRLKPDAAIITAIDPDHLDIYGSAEEFNQAFVEFSKKIKSDGLLIAQKDLHKTWPENLKQYSYGLNGGTNTDFNGRFECVLNGNFRFGFEGKGMYPSKLEHIHCGLPGFHNIENATAALALTLNVLNLPENEVTKALASFRGAKRRFEYVVKTENKIVIDDYAHHPQELNAIIGSVKELYPNKKLTAIFQPHLFTRTRDFADGFAESLSKPDETILMDIYPARELPIEGITSEWLLSKINSKNKILMMPDEIIEYVKANRPELLLILGAGDIDRLVPKIKEVYHGI